MNFPASGAEQPAPASFTRAEPPTISTPGKRPFRRCGWAGGLSQNHNESFVEVIMNTISIAPTAAQDTVRRPWDVKGATPLNPNKALWEKATLPALRRA